MRSSASAHHHHHVTTTAAAAAASMRFTTQSKPGPKCRRCIRFDAPPSLSSSTKESFKSAGDSLHFIESLMHDIRIQDRMRWPFLPALEKRIDEEEAMLQDHQQQIQADHVVPS
jgi:hypothetical protein